VNHEHSDRGRGALPDVGRAAAEHRWLRKLVGEWTYEGEASMAPGQTPMKMAGVERVRSISGLWTVAEGESRMPDGSPATTIMTLGFDPRRTASSAASLAP
jgi:hypothetical protein